MIIMYLRKSRQDDPSETVEEVLSKHEAILQDYALKNFKYAIPEENIYREVVSGETISDRPMLQEVFRMMESGNVDSVLAVEPQRLTRGDLLDCGTVIRNFMYTNTKIVTPTKAYDLNDKYDKKFFEMELMRGNDYLEYTKEILARGREQSARSGNFIASIPPYGYDRAKQDKGYILVPNPTESKVVKQIFEWYISGDGEYVICNKLTEMGILTRHDEPFKRSTIRQILSNEVYIGKIKYQSKKTVKTLENGVVVKKSKRMKDYELFDGKHTPILDEETFYKAKNRYKKNHSTRNDYELKNMFAGIMKCGVCGKAIGQSPSRKGSRYLCRNKQYCTNISHYCDEVNQAIIDNLKQKVTELDITVKNDKESNLSTMVNTQLEASFKRLEELNKIHDKLCTLLETGVYDVKTFVDRDDKNKQEIKELTENIEKLKKVPTISTAREIQTSIYKCIEVINDDELSVETKNKFLKSIIKTIYYEKDERNIKLNIVMKGE